MKYWKIAIILIGILVAVVVIITNKDNTKKYDTSIAIEIQENEKVDFNNYVGYEYAEAHTFYDNTLISVEDISDQIVSEFNYDYKSDWGIKVDDKLEEEIYFHGGSIAISTDNHIYFTHLNSLSTVDATGYLFRMDHNGNAVELVSNSPARFFRELDGYLFFSDVSQSGNLRCFEMSTNTFIEYGDYYTSDYTFKGDNIYLVEKNSHDSKKKIVKISSKNGDYIDTIIEDYGIGNIVCNDEQIYITKLEDMFSLNILDEEKKELEAIFSGYYVMYGMQENSAVMMNDGIHLLTLDNNKINTLLCSGPKIGVNEVNFYENLLIYRGMDLKMYLYNGVESICIYDEMKVNHYTVAGNWLIMSTTDIMQSTQQSYFTVLRNITTDEIIEIDSGAMVKYKY